MEVLNLYFVDVNYLKMENFESVTLISIKRFIIIMKHMTVNYDKKE